MVSVTLSSLSLVADPEPIDPGAAAMIAFGLMVAAVTCLSGLLLARAPWGRWGLAAVVVLAMGLASVSNSWLVWLAYAVGAGALVGLLGPWLRLWTRHRPAVESPGPVSVSLMAVAASAPLVIGLTAAAGIHWSHWLLMIVAVISSVTYAQGTRIGLWGLRVAVPIIGAYACGNTNGWGALVLAGAVAVVTVLAWLPAALRTTTVITPPLPSPVPRRPT